DHVAYHVTAGAQRGYQHVVHGANRRFQIALAPAVELVTLARRDAQRAVAVAVRQLVDHEVLLAGEHAARKLATDHELVSRLAVCAASLTALIAILLLVRPVELEELRASVREVIGAGRQLLGEMPAQAAALLLHLLDRARRLVGHATTSAVRRDGLDVTAHDSPLTLHGKRVQATFGLPDAAPPPRALRLAGRRGASA